MTVACADVGGINMAQGVCDTDPPHPVVEAAIAAIRSGQNIYTRLDGVAPLREAIAQKLASRNGLSVDPHTQGAGDQRSDGGIARCVVGAAECGRPVCGVGAVLRLSREHAARDASGAGGCAAHWA